MSTGGTLEVPNATFRLVGGDPVLDFVNTASWYRTPARTGRDYLELVGKERLVVAGDVVRWGITAGVVPVGVKVGEASRRVLPRARALRRAIHRLLKGVIEGWPAHGDDLAALDLELAPARAHAHLGANGNAFGWEWRTTLAPEDRVLWTVARHAADLLTSDLLGQVGECNGVECGWLYLDTTRNHSRRWCDMADCGNLAKVRKFRGK
jgi:predicted RNA-binding Zn ribbon-like protein